jgi:hypothetical protein
MQAKWWRSGFFYLLLLAVVLALVFAFMPSERPEPVSLYEFIERVKQEGEIDTIEHDGETLTGKKDKKAIITTVFRADTNDVVDYLEKEGVNLQAEGIEFYAKDSGLDWGTIALTVILPIVLRQEARCNFRRCRWNR